MSFCKECLILEVKCLASCVTTVQVSIFSPSPDPGPDAPTSSAWATSSNTTPLQPQQPLQQLQPLKLEKSCISSNCSATQTNAYTRRVQSYQLT